MSSYTGPRPTPFQAGCSVCSRLFGGVTGFDEHRKAGVCQDPGELGYVEDDRGVWRKPMEQEKIALFKQRVHGNKGRD